MNRKLFKHMTKAQIRAAKIQSKKRHNRRLKDGEADRLMAIASNVLGINDKDDHIRFPGIEDGCKLDVADAMIYSRDGYDKKNHRSPKKMSLKMKEALRVLANGGMDISRFYPNGKKKVKAYKRLTTRQFESLMKEASEKLGINDNKTTPIMEVDKYRRHGTGELIDLILATLDYSEKSRERQIRKEYEKIIKNKKIRKNKDKLAVLAYLMRTTYSCPSPSCQGEFSREIRPLAPLKIPMCLLDKKQKTNEVRKIIKFHGDKNRPIRIMPDEEWLKIKSGKKRTKFDAFDRMDDDKKIEWARQANLVLRIDNFEEMYKCNFLGIKSFGANNIAFAMKYACKICKMPEFKGIFAAPYWIVDRIEKYYDRITSKEFNTFYEMALEHLGIKETKTIPILNKKQVIKRLIPTLKRRKLYREYQQTLKNYPSSYHKERYSLDIIKDLLLNHA